MGYDGDLNKNYSLIWQFQVDANFTYLLRLHFCDYQAENVNKRVFDIYINNQTAPAGADVITWANHSSIRCIKSMQYMSQMLLAMNRSHWPSIPQSIQYHHLNSMMQFPTGWRFTR